MKLEDFGIYELKKYLHAEDAIEEMEAKYNSERELAFISSFPSCSVDEVTGKIHPIGKNVEDVALELVDLERSYKVLIKRHKERLEVLQRAISNLADNERYVFERRLIEKECLNGEGHELLKKAVVKVCTFINEERNVKKKRDYKKGRAELRRQSNYIKRNQRGNIAI